MKRVIYSVLIFSTLLCSCKDSGTDSDIQPSIIPEGSITLENPLPEKIFYFVVEREAASLILWAPTLSENTPTIDSLSSVQVPIKDIYGITAQAEEVIFYWWTANTTQDGISSTSEIESEIIELWK